MDKKQLRTKHYKVILRREIINILEVLHIKNLLRRSVESNTPAFKEVLDIEESNHNIIVLPNIPWNYRWQRPQQLFSRLAKKGFNIFYISPITTDKEYLSKIAENIYEVHLKTRTSGNVLRDFHLNPDNENDFIESFKRLLGRYINKSTSLFILHPVWKNVSFRIDTVKRIYDLMDLYSGFDDARPELVEGEKDLIGDSDIVLATAQDLYDHAKLINKNTFLVRNGCDFEMFSNLKKNGSLDGLTDKPIIGYFGAIRTWLDSKTLESVIKKNRDKYFIFIGSVDTNSVRNLYKYKNVYFLGEVSHNDLPGYLAYFNVCTIPYVLTDLLLSTNPVKFYEYIASGKPVISSNLPELKQYSDMCYLYNSADEFDSFITRALGEADRKLQEKRIKTAKENSWDSRVSEIIKILKV
jgi:glycosyltransferase involved in cell wall biosynthesis